MRDREKNPAAVALGKRAYEAKSPEQREAFIAAGKAALRRKTPAERSAISRRSAMTRRLAGPAWLRKQNSTPAPSFPLSGFDAKGTIGATERNTPAPAELPPDLAHELPPDLAHLARAIDSIPDELLEGLFDALAGRRA